MSVEEICQLDVASVAADDCVLFLWATFPQLQEALQVIKAWDFQYKTVAFVWLKQNKSGKGWFFGLGFWTRGNAELCLLATRGKPRRQSNRVHQLIISPLRQHSQKPSEAREKSSSLWESCHGWSCLPVRKPTDGTLGEMKSYVMLQ